MVETVVLKVRRPFHNPQIEAPLRPCGCLPVMRYTRGAVIVHGICYPHTGGAATENLLEILIDKCESTDEWSDDEPRSTFFFLCVAVELFVLPTLVIHQRMVVYITLTPRVCCRLT